eukprot:5056125-Prymnesium_polylepis.2
MGRTIRDLTNQSSLTGETEHVWLPTPNMKAALPLLVCVLAARASAACAGLRCVFKGSGLVWTSSAWGELDLAVNENQTAAHGTLMLIGVSEESVDAALKWGVGDTEVLLTWEANGIAYSGLVVLSDAARMLVHESTGRVFHITAGTDAVAAEAESDELLEAAGEGGNETTAVAARTVDASATLGTLSAVVHLTAQDDVCIVENGTSVQLGSCQGAGAMWEVGRGGSPAHRSLRSPATGLCLQRACFRGGSNAVRLAECGK